ncbi:MAG: RelA/SpoT family protein [Gammaproteobacteria bacterium]|nr:RelA/SpoT family protein [Gammaproteobacteria bacterium]
MRLFRKLEKRLSYLDKGDIEKIKQAFNIANEAHEGQKRSSGENYIIHPIAVAVILSEMRMDADSIIAGLLHDTIEDTKINKDKVTQLFGKTIAELVDGVTKLTKINFSSKAEAQAESFRKMVLAMSQDIRVIIIKLADRLHNMRTLTSLPTNKQRRIARETLGIYAPIAHRLGMHEFYIELEDLSFAACYPLRYKVLKASIKRASGNRKEILRELEKEVKKHFSKGSINSLSISCREKHLYSVYRKMRKKHLQLSEIMDLYGFRIIVNSKDDCYRALGVAHSLYKPLPGKFKDYIAIPKINGYQSLHTLLFGPHGVPVEIQIRTTDMDQVANKGIAAHWLYKSDEKQDASHIKAQRWISNMLEMQKATGNSLEFVENVKIDLFPEQIYVFTPNGGIMELPRGSTIIDFAYAVHTGVGNCCVAAKIDRQYAALSTVLNNGQTITIITSPNARPNPAWLSFIKTGKARSAIRHYLKQQQGEDAINLGRELLEKSLNNLATSIDKIPKDTIKATLKEMELTSLDDLLADIGLGNRVAMFVAHQLLHISKQKSRDEKSEQKPLIIRGAEGMVVNCASCCLPIPGDPAVGIISRGHGLVLHSDRCAKIAAIRKKPDRYILVQWADDVKGDFLTLIHARIKHRRGTFAELTKTISDAGANIEDVTVRERSGDTHLIALKIYVHNRDHLHKVIHRLESINSVVNVFRVHNH